MPAVPKKNWIIFYNAKLKELQAGFTPERPKLCLQAQAPKDEGQLDLANWVWNDVLWRAMTQLVDVWGGKAGWKGPKRRHEAGHGIRGWHVRLRGLRRDTAHGERTAVSRRGRTCVSVYLGAQSGVFSEVWRIRW